MKKRLLTFALLISSAFAFAQIKTPAPSPLAELEQTVGLTEIEIEYSRPGVKDRTIFGELVPYGKLWRFGANASTKIEFSTDVTINGKKVEEGKYALFCIPNEDEWTMIIHKDLQAGTWNYKEENDLMRFKVKPEEYKEKVENFTLDFIELRNTYGVLAMTWDNTRISFKIEVEFDEMVMKAIEETLAGPSAGDYYRAARYYLENDKDINQALTWINKSIELDGKEKYWVLRQKSLIQYKAGFKKEAIKTAERSLALAKEDGDDAYVLMNEESIKEWKK